MASLLQPPPVISTKSTVQVQLRRLKLFNSPKPYQGYNFHHRCLKCFPVFCTNMSSWEPAPVTYAPTDDAGSQFLKGTTSIFETLSSQRTDEASLTSIEEAKDSSNRIQQSVHLQYLKWPMWLLGPAILLATGMAPTLWLPISAIFLGPNVASLLSLTGLDCIFHLGASLFLLMADSCSRPKTQTEVSSSRASFMYKFWNVLASTTGFIIPLLTLLGSQKGILQPHLPPISFVVLLGPYLLLLSVQMLMEALTWHWQSPVWLVTPIVYEAYRVLQLMRGLKLGAELNAPAWMLHTIRGMVCWWVTVLGVQLMRVAWYAGFTARARQQQHSALAVGNN